MISVEFPALIVKDYDESRTEVSDDFTAITRHHPIDRTRQLTAPRSARRK